MSAPIAAGRRFAGPGARVAAGRAAGAAVVLLAVALPWLVGDYPISIASRVLSLGLLAVSVHLLAATTGLASLGQAGLFAVGGYTAAIVARDLTRIGVVQVAAATLAAALVAAVSGIAVMRTRGIVFVMVTLAAGELTYTAAEQWRGVTGGGDGLATPFVVPVWGMREVSADGPVYLWVLSVFLVAYLVTAIILRSPLGLAMRGTGDSEPRMRALGYPVTGNLLAAYTVSGALAGAAGALWVSTNSYITSADVTFGVSAMALVAVVIGGLRSTWGAVAGTAIVVLVRDVLVGSLSGPMAAQGPLLLGVLLVICVYVFPGGISGLFSGGHSVLPLVVARQRSGPDAVAATSGRPPVRRDGSPGHQDRHEPTSAGGA